MMYEFIWKTWREQVLDARIYINSIQYADGTVLVADSEENL